MGTLYLDSNAFISYLEGEPAVSVVLGSLFESLRTRAGVGVTSELTLAEVLAGSHKSGPGMRRAYLDLLVWNKNLELAPVSRDVLYQGAELCAVHKQAVGRKLRLLDAIHLATAVQTNCRYFVSADKSIVPPEGMKKVGFDADSIDEVRKGFA